MLADARLPAGAAVWISRMPVVSTKPARTADAPKGVAGGRWPWRTVKAWSHDDPGERRPGLCGGARRPLWLRLGWFILTARFSETQLLSIYLFLLVVYIDRSVRSVR
jgi:hypothetical protein